MTQEERLQKLIAKAGVASRRAAEGLISAGRVKVDGIVIKQQGIKVNPQSVIEVDGQRIAQEERKIYILMYKPSGCVTTLSDPEGRKTVLDFIKGVTERIYPVGRLDYETSGALLLTNDGELANRLMHPSYGIAKVYQAVVAGRVPTAVLQKLEEGVSLDDGMTAPALVRVIGTDGRSTRIELTIHEGRNRQVRRMMDAVGYPCVSLVRSAYGSLNLNELKPGSWRRLSVAEVANLTKPRKKSSFK